MQDKQSGEKGKMTNTPKVVFSVLAVIIFISSCVTYSHTSKNSYPAKEKNCNFSIQASSPDQSDYEEIGVFNGCSGENNITDYKEKIRDDVCRAGGDLVVGQVNGYGVYCRGILFKKRNVGAD